MEYEYAYDDFCTYKYEYLCVSYVRHHGVQGRQDGAHIRSPSSPTAVSHWCIADDVREWRVEFQKIFYIGSIPRDEADNIAADIHLWRRRKRRVPRRGLYLA